MLAIISLNFKDSIRIHLERNKVNLYKARASYKFAGHIFSCEDKDTLAKVLCIKLLYGIKVQLIVNLTSRHSPKIYSKVNKSLLVVGMNFKKVAEI